MREPKEAKLQKSWDVSLLNIGLQTLFSAGILHQERMFDPERMKEEAVKLSGNSDLDYEPIREPFEWLCGQFQRHKKLMPVGCWSAKEEMVNFLAYRTDFVRDTPLFEGKSLVRDPIIILGAPRSGTTFLQNLFVQDDRARWLKRWEILSPVLPPDQYELSKDRRPECWDREIETTARRFPQVHELHGIDSPGECIDLFCSGFVSHLFELRFGLEEYRDWISKDGIKLMPEQYDYFWRQLQRLALYENNEFWVSKSPHHMSHLPHLCGLTPEIRIVRMHRQMEDVVRSFCNLQFFVQQVFCRNVDPVDVGESSMWHLQDMATKALESKSWPYPNKVADVVYPDLVNEPVGLMRRLYAELDIEFREEDEKRLEDYVSRKHRGRKSGKRLPLEFFGLTAERVEKTFCDYEGEFGLR